jgi:selenide,water dikinase
MVAPLHGLAPPDPRVLVGPHTADDSGAMAFGDAALVATVDFITPFCDDPYRFGRVAAANSMSDVFAMGGEVLFALNICCFPEDQAPSGVFTEILHGGLDAVTDAGGVLLGGHSVGDRELKYGLAVVGRADPERLLTNAAARPGQRLILTKPLGCGAILNAFRGGKLDEAGLEPVLVSMERLNAVAARLALRHGATGATDVTGFGLVGHGLEIARASGVGLRIEFSALPVYAGFYEMTAAGVSTKGTRNNRAATAAEFEDLRDLDEHQQALLFDPQTSGGLLICTPADQTDALVSALRDAGEPAAVVGEVVEGTPRVTIV